MKSTQESGFCAIIELLANERKYQRGFVPNIPRSNPQTMVMHTPLGPMSFETGWDYIARQLVGE